MRRRPLAIPDPNVRVQAVIDGQGVAINDPLVPTELASGALHRISTVELDTYGYRLALPKDAFRNPDIALLVPWLKSVDSSWRGFDRNRCAPWVVRREIEPGESWKVATPERPYRPA